MELGIGHGDTLVDHGDLHTNQTVSDVYLAIFMAMLFGYATHRILKEIKMTNEDAIAKLNDINANIQKIGTETTTLLAKIEELKAAATNAGDISPELQAAIDAVAVQAKTVDDQVPDV